MAKRCRAWPCIHKKEERNLFDNNDGRAFPLGQIQEVPKARQKVASGKRPSAQPLEQRTKTCSRPARARELTNRTDVMPATYCSLHYHIVFSTKDRLPTLTHDWRSNMHAYLGGIVKSLKGVPVAIGGVEDHVHLLVGLRATHCLSDVLRELKSGSSEWAHVTVGKKQFAWQPGYFGSTVSPSQIGKVEKYILSQEGHHRRKNFQEEYLELLRLSGIEYDERYVW
jgi:putative transposase